MKKDKLINLMVKKSEESFLLAIEIYNKPTIKYRVEGFAFFICNAWELLLKAKLLDQFGESSIYYPTKSGISTRTITLSKCIKEIFTNDKDPLRINLEQIVELRDTSTHFVIPQYEKVYSPLFQSCLLNYIKKAKDFFKINVKENLNTTMLNIMIDQEELSEVELIEKYDECIIKKLNRNSKKIAEVVDASPNDKLAIKIDYNYSIVKNPKDAKSAFRVTTDAQEAIMFIDKPRNANLTHPYNGKRLIEKVNEKLSEGSIEIAIGYSELKLICKNNNYYENLDFCYKIETDANLKYTYSEKLLNEICKIIKKDPEVFIKYKNKKS